MNSINKLNNYHIVGLFFIFNGIITFLYVLTRIQGYGWGFISDEQIVYRQLSWLCGAIIFAGAGCFFVGCLKE